MEARRDIIFRKNTRFHQGEWKRTVDTKEKGMKEPWSRKTALWMATCKR
jgi:hypothetical protein